MAAKYGKVRVAQLLLERGAHPDAAGKVSLTFPPAGVQPGPRGSCARWSSPPEPTASPLRMGSRPGRMASGETDLSDRDLALLERPGGPSERGCCTAPSAPRTPRSEEVTPRTEEVTPRTEEEVTPRNEEVVPRTEEEVTPRTEEVTPQD